MEIKRKIVVALGCDLSEKENVDDHVKSHELNYRWLCKKVHIQGVLFFQENKGGLFAAKDQINRLKYLHRVF